MKSIVRVEPTLMFNINRNRVHDVRRGTAQLADEDGGRGANLKGKNIQQKKICDYKNRLRRKIVITGNS